MGMISGFSRSHREAENGHEAAAPRAAGRPLDCPACGAHFEVSLKAINARCPKCTRPMRFEDADLNGFCNQSVSTMGTVRIGRKGVVRGRIECGQLVVSGQLDGTIRITGRCIVQPNGVLRGQIAARSMLVERGAMFEGTLEIGAGPVAGMPAA